VNRPGFFNPPRVARREICPGLRLEKSMKNYVKLFPLGLGLFLILPAAVRAQDVKAPTPLQIRVGDVSDTRSTSQDSGCQVELIFTGDVVQDAGNVREVRITEATDEVGRNLVMRPDEDNNNNNFNRFNQFNNGRNPSAARRAEARLRNPSRNSATIKILKGEVVFFNPNEVNGGRLTLPGVLAHPAEPIQNPGLAKYGIQMMYLTKATFEAKKKELDAQGNGATDPKLGALREAFTGPFANGTMFTGQPNAVQLYVLDPDQRIVNLKFVDGQGKAVQSNGGWTSNNYRNFNFNTPPPADMQLVIELATPEALQPYPFSLENIPLP
jgi:hypothetical protein